MRKPGKLTLQQKKFCENYIANGNNGAQAISAAGYETKYPEKEAYRMLQRHEVKRYLGCRLQKISTELQVTTQWKVNLIVDMIKACVEGRTNEKGLPDVDGVYKGIHLLTKLGIGGTYVPEQRENLNIALDMNRIAPLIEKYEQKLITHEPAN